MGRIGRSQTNWTGQCQCRYRRRHSSLNAPKYLSLKTSPPPRHLKDKQKHIPVGDLEIMQWSKPFTLQTRKQSTDLLKSHRITFLDNFSQPLPSFLTIEALPAFPTLSNAYLWQRNLNMFAGTKTGSANSSWLPTVA